MQIQQVVEERPTYGYRRVTAVLNRQFEKEGRPRVNHKRIHRVMRENELTWRPPERKPVRTHEGKVIVEKSDMRWCSDTFEIWCWDNSIVRVGFSLDCCDREIISWVATTAGINGEMIRDLIAESVDARFGNVERTPHTIEWLSDNGSIYTGATPLPLFEYMTSRIKNSKMIWTDDTPVRMMDKELKKRCRTGQIWVYRGDELNPYVLSVHAVTQKRWTKRAS